MDAMADSETGGRAKGAFQGDLTTYFGGEFSRKSAEKPPLTLQTALSCLASLVTAIWT